MARVRYIISKACLQEFSFDYSEQRISEHFSQLSQPIPNRVVTSMYRSSKRACANMQGSGHVWYFKEFSSLRVDKNRRFIVVTSSMAGGSGGDRGQVGNHPPPGFCLMPFIKYLKIYPNQDPDRLCPPNCYSAQDFQIFQRP